MEFEDAEIIDSNGTQYRVGKDEHGWFTIQRGVLMNDDGEAVFHSDDTPPVNFPPDKVPDVAEIIERNF